jgi:N-acyl-D-aspartate/D-glutamate deacylase
LRRTLLTGGTVFDGSGVAPIVADVLIDGDRIEAIGPGLGAGMGGEDSTVIDVAGLAVCPGFVDIHTHSDFSLFSTPHAASKVRQGVTTEIVGNCGLTSVPFPVGGDLAGLRDALGTIDVDPALDPGWGTTVAYLDALEQAGPAVNVAALTGHMPLRIATVGLVDRPANPAEITQMCAMLEESFAAGAIGFSTGLNVAPLCFATAEELLAIGSTVAAHDRVFAWHMRNYANTLVEAVDEVLTVARKTGCRTQISHLTAIGKRNWEKIPRVLEMVDAARDEGCAVSVDIYPYLHGSAGLSQLLPAWVQEGGSVDLIAKMAKPEVRERVRQDWIAGPTEWDEIVVSRIPEGEPEQELAGMTIAEIAERDGRDGADTAMDLLGRFGHVIQMIAGGRNEQNLKDVLAHPATVIGSDGLSLDPAEAINLGVPHPRSFGCYPRYLSRYTPSSDAEFAEAVRRCTSAPAQIVGLRDRGLLQRGAKADVVALDRARLTDRATMTDPQQFSDGLELVLVNGETVIQHGEQSARRPGRVLRAGN